MLPPLAIASLPISSAVATEVAATFLGPSAVKIVSAALVVSIFSALQVMTLLAARVPYAMASDGLFLKWLAEPRPAREFPCVRSCCRRCGHARWCSRDPSMH